VSDYEDLLLRADRKLIGGDSSNCSTPLSREMTRLLSLVIFDGWELFPGKAMRDPLMESPIDYAKRIGTYKQDDRSKQYEGRYSNEILRRNDDLLFERQRKAERRRTWDKLLLLVAAALIANAPKLWAFFASLLH
jgi:hypothetical protein